MSGIAAIIGGLGLAGSVTSGILGSNAAKSAANAQAGAADQASMVSRQNAMDALAFQKQQYGNSLQMAAPWLASGSGAASKLSYLMGIPGVSPLSQQSIANGFGSQQNTQQIPGGLLNFLRNGGDLSSLPGIGNRPSGGFQPMSAQGAMVPSSGGGSAIMPNGTAGQNFSGGPQSFGSPGGPQASGNPGGTVPGAGGIMQANGGGSAVVGNNDFSQLPNHDPSGDSSAGGGFGSLLTPYGQTFQSPTDVTEQNDPGYKFRLQQGMDALQNSAAARGGLLSGGTAKSLNDYAQNSASGEYQNVYNRALTNFQTGYNQYNNDQNTIFNRLASLSGQGQTQAAQLSSAGQGAANNIGNILLGSAGQQGQDLQNAGAARGSGYVGSANALGGGLSGGLNSLSGALTLQALLGQQGGGASSSAGFGVI